MLSEVEEVPVLQMMQFRHKEVKLPARSFIPTKPAYKPGAGLMQSLCLEGQDPFLGTPTLYALHVSKMHSFPPLSVCLCHSFSLVCESQ